ncbi:mechanosensitive ion channel family protein [Pseudobacteriovorax antillogorgiicola]|uniref:MscS family membrane protein n=1 Tax=Pseudobacteriovorax antillogorgiicola TaxID=1513793 RepID=A0A1Y6C024_9BACT|nr:mechanosensitive ion channel family protein [Pseudobacteriovorax antillogorgiicola]TCS53008.1 MscS family membrane protein [Pseudobacteriovorax antillogorgiicola]SMF27002.1 MscS family membrane protein [Pseudobacteriovorax antillogorgiicola]
MKILATILILLASPIWAQNAPQAGSNGSTIPSKSPRQSIQVFLQAMKNGDYATAELYAELPRVSRKQRQASLDRAYEVIDQIFRLNTLNLSPEPEGYRNDELPFDMELLFHWQQDEQSLSFFLRRKEVKDGGQKTMVWQIDRSSLQSMSKTKFNQNGYDLASHVPDSLKIKVFRLQIWQWLGLAVGIVLAFGMSWVLRKLFIRILRSALSVLHADEGFTLAKRMANPFQIYSIVAIFGLLTYSLALDFRSREMVSIVERAVQMICSVWALFVINDGIFILLAKKLEEDGKPSVAAILPISRRSISIIIAVLGGLFFLQNLGYDITALITGLGIGGIAIALAGQKTVENLLGGFMIIIDQPIRVGDYGRYGDTWGTVETIGLRSTRVRTLDRTLVTIPNADFSQMNIENYAERDQIRLHAILGVRHETSPDQLRYLLAEIKRLLVAHQRIDNDPARVRFVGFGASSLDIEIFAYAKTSIWPEFLSIREDVYLDILKLVRESGTSFAYPSQTIYWEKGQGINQAATERVEEVVHQWRENKEMPFPDIPEDVITTWTDTRDYPNLDSWIHKLPPRP